MVVGKSVVLHEALPKGGKQPIGKDQALRKINLLESSFHRWEDLELERLLSWSRSNCFSCLVRLESVTGAGVVRDRPLVQRPDGSAILKKPCRSVDECEIRAAGPDSRLSAG